MTRRRREKYSGAAGLPFRLTVRTSRMSQTTAGSASEPTGREARAIQLIALASSSSSSPACSPGFSSLRSAERSTAPSGAPFSSVTTTGTTLVSVSMTEARVLAAETGQVAAVNSAQCW